MQLKFQSCGSQLHGGTVVKQAQSSRVRPPGLTSFPSSFSSQKSCKFYLPGGLHWIKTMRLKDLPKPVPLFSMVYTNILIDCSRILRSSENSDGNLERQLYHLSTLLYILLIFMWVEYSKAGGVLRISYSRRLIRPYIWQCQNYQSLRENLQLA